MTENPEDRKGPLDWLSARLNLTEIFSLLTSYGLFFAELDSRKPFREALDEALEQPLPQYTRWPRVLGLMVVVLLSIEILTGTLLALYYLPTPETAHPSLGTILRDVDFGWFVHQMHFWGAQLLIALLIVRVVRFFAQAVYRAPRELVWVFAALLLLVCLHLDLTGRALPYTTNHYWSVVRAIEVVSSVPIYGSLVVFMLGGAQAVLSELTLIRLYILHVAILPVAAIVLVYLHFSTVRRVGLTPTRRGEEEAPGRLAVRGNLVQLAILLVLMVGFLVTLAVIVPLPFRAEADPFSTETGVGPPWYLLAPFGFLEWSSGWLPRSLAGGLLFIGFFLFVILPPLYGSRGEQPRQKRILLLGVIVFAVWIFFSIYGARVA